MTNQHPIQPSPGLVKQWLAEPEYVSGWNGKCMMLSITDFRFNNICAKAAQWGADQELEACCEWLELNYNYTRSNHPLRTARRPKPPSLKEQALAELGDVYNRDKIDDVTYDTIRRAIEQLPN